MNQQQQEKNRGRTIATCHGLNGVVSAPIAKTWKNAICTNFVTIC